MPDDSSIFDGLAAPAPAAAPAAAPQQAQPQDVPQNFRTAEYLAEGAEALQSHPDFQQMLAVLAANAKESKDPAIMRLTDMLVFALSGMAIKFEALAEQVETGMSDDTVEAFEEIEKLLDEVMSANSRNAPGLKKLIEKNLAAAKKIIADQIGEEGDEEG